MTEGLVRPRTITQMRNAIPASLAARLSVSHQSSILGIHGREVASIPAGEAWLLNRLGRQYTRTMSRQIFAYCVAYHMTGEEEYLRYSRLGLGYLFTRQGAPRVR